MFERCTPSQAPTSQRWRAVAAGTIKMARKMPSSPPCDVLSFAKRMRPSLRRRDGSGAFLISAAVLLDRAGGGHMSYAGALDLHADAAHKWSPPSPSRSR